MVIILIPSQAEQERMGGRISSVHGEVGESDGIPDGRMDLVRGARVCVSEDGPGSY